MKVQRIVSFVNSKRKYFVIPVLSIFVATLLLLFSTHMVKANFASWGDTSLIHSCVSNRGIPNIVSSSDTCLTGETQATWLKDVNAGTGLSISRNSSGATISLSSAMEMGWTSSNDSWAYASANSFTITGSDRTATFTPGTRVKATNNSTTYYGVVDHASYSGGNTTVTLVANSDYALANSAITAPYYSYQANPQGYPGWFSYSPTWTGFSSNPSSVVARFSMVGTTVTVTIHCGGGGTSNSTSTAVSLPTSGAQNVFAGFIDAYDNGSHVTNPGVAVIDAQGSTTLDLYTSTGHAAWTSSGSKAANFSLTYEH